MEVNIIGFEKYTVNENGDVFSLDYKGTGKKVKMTWSKKDNGYFFVGLRKPKEKKKYFYIHRLVAMHFINNPNKYPEVNHLDGNKENNNVSNLEWCNNKQNSKHAVENRLGTRGMKYKNNSSGYVGVSIKGTHAKRFVANIRVDGKRIYLGAFYSASDAFEAYKLASKKYHGDSLKNPL